MEAKGGDVIHVRMNVVKGGWSLTVDAMVDGQIVTVPKTAIVHVEPRPLAVGDWVRCKLHGPSVVLVICAIDHDRAWVRFRNSDARDTALLKDLSLATGFGPD